MKKKTDLLNRPYYTQVNYFYEGSEDWHDIKEYIEAVDVFSNENFFDAWDVVDGMELRDTYDTPTPFIGEDIKAIGNDGDYVLTLTNTGDYALYRKTDGFKVLEEYDRNPKQKLSHDVQLLVAERKECA